MSTAEVDEWFAKKSHPQDAAMNAVRRVILGADQRIEETIKWSTPTFMYKGNIASFNPAKKFVSLLFHRGAEIPGNYPGLEGEGDVARVMRFVDEADVLAGQLELEAVIHAWCAWKDG